MPVLRFIAGLLILAAVVTLVRDASPWLAGIAPFEMKSLVQHLTELSPRTLAALRGSVGPWLWDLAVSPVLQAPTVVTLALLGAGIGWLGRRRRNVSVFAN